MNLFQKADLNKIIGKLFKIQKVYMKMDKKTSLLRKTYFNKKQKVKKISIEKIKDVKSIYKNG